MLSSRDEQILKVIHLYRYMTAQDVAYRLFSPSSKTHVRELLSSLAGNADGQNNQFLYRFGLPKAQKGNVERIYTLGARGRDVLATLGMSVGWYYRPSKASNQSYSHIVHSLMMTRFSVAAHFWARDHSAYRVIDERMSYTFPPGAVIPDAWLQFERRDGVRGSVLLEIDRGTEFKERFQSHIRSRLHYVQSGEYEKTFGQKAVIAAYVSVGDNPTYRQTRLKTMQVWAMEVLREEGRENWARMFRFTEVGLGEVYTKSLFDTAVWYAPDKDNPIPIFGER